MKKFFLVFIIFHFLVNFQFLFSQINTDIYRDITPKEGFANNLNLTFDYAKGNSNNLQFAGTYDLDYFYKPFFAQITFSKKYKEYNDTTIISSSGFVYFNTEIFTGKLIHPEIFVQNNYNFDQNLKNRNLFGAYARIRPISFDFIGDSTDDFYLFVGIGGMYEKENYTVNFPPENLFRSANYISLRVTFDTLASIYSTTFYQVKPTDFTNYRILSDNTFVFNLSTYLSFNFAIHYFFNSVAIPGIVNYDITIDNGITVSF